MTQRLLRTLWVPAVLALFLLPALVPLVRTASLPCTHDNVFHLFRIVAIRDMTRHGWFFSRWVPNLALGYGYPFFSYREPLPYLTGAVLFAARLPLPLVLGLIYAASLICAAWGAYILGRDLFGPRAGWIAGVAYGLGPYVLLDPLRRGNMPESVALALLPWLFVSTRRVILGRGRGAILVTVSLLTTLFLSHNISGLLLAPFLGLYVLLLTWQMPERSRRGWISAFAAVAVAVLLTAWFWLPALLERDWVQLHLSRTTRNNDFHYNFVTWREILLTLPAPYDAAYLNLPMRVYLGIGQAVLAVIGVGEGLWHAQGRDPQARLQRLLIGLLAGAALVYLWMGTPGSVRVWEALPLLSFVQFPWRLVGRALLPVSLLAGLAFESIPGRPVQTGLGHRKWLTDGALMAALTALTLLAWPDTYPPKGICVLDAYPGMPELYALEQEGWIGMDPESSYFPIWVEDHPDDLSLATTFVRGELPVRLDTTSLPEGAIVVAEAYTPLGAELVIRSPEAFRARWLGLYFPGWQVIIDDAPVPVAPEDDTGLLTFIVPDGEHRIHVRFSNATPARRLGIILTAVGIVGLVPLILVGRRTATVAAMPAGRYRSSTGLLIALSGIAVMLVMVRFRLVPQIDTPVARSRLRGAMAAERAGADFRLPEVSTPAFQDFEGGLTLLGYTLTDEQVAGDRELAVTLLWGARETPTRHYRTAVLLRGPDGELWSAAGGARPRGYEDPPPTVGWPEGAYAYDPHLVAPLPGTPPGTYEVVVSAFDAETLAPASVLDSQGAPMGADLVLGQVRVLAPAEPPGLTTLGVPHEATSQACGPLMLWAMDVDRQSGAPGDVVAVRWVWEALSTPQSPVAAWLHLVDSEGVPVTTWELPAAAAWWPTDRWTAGERWLGQHVVRLPGGLDSGHYTLELELPICSEKLAEETLTVTAPERVWTVPEDMMTVDMVLGDQVRLAGYAVTPLTAAPGDEIVARLAWQALGEMMTSYRVYAHLIDPGGHLVDQDDGEPAAWSRPTTGWALDEVVAEARSLQVPGDAVPGIYTVRVGLYTPDGERLPTPAGDDGYVVAMIEVQE